MLNDLKELEKFLKLCRKQGITDISFDGVTVKFGELPAKTSQVEESEEIPTDGLSEDEMAFFHLRGQPQ